ncbi:MAG: hypothetical protein J7L45_02805, partial [Candidatus Aenigmarchaeota archaeon]|nr:hypothetical protein [Candidatus Aenigmarchaeota archaeon]
MSGDFLDRIWMLETDTGDYNKNIIIMDWREETREKFGAAIFYCTDNALLHGPTAPNIMKYLGSVDDSRNIQHEDFPRIGDKIMGIFLSDEIFNKNPRKYISQKVKEIAP